MRIIVDSYVDNLEKSRLREGLKAALEVSHKGNEFLTQTEPWKKLKVDPASPSALTHLAAAVGVVRLLAVLFSPFTPRAAGLYLQYLGLDPESGCLTDEVLAAVNTPEALVAPGHVLGQKPLPVFSKIEPSQVEVLRAHFSGGQQEEKRTTIAAKSSRKKHQREECRSTTNNAREVTSVTLP